MAEISQVKSQDDFPVTIRKLMRLGNAYAVTLPPAWVRSLNPGNPHYLTVHVSHDGSVVVRNLKCAPDE
jgi:antitoxin component of MazEF toxin-antitoxin module